MSGNQVTYTTHAFASEIAAAKITDPIPIGLRIARTPDGRERLQAAYRWSKGLTGGVEWRDVEIVDVAE